MPFMAQNLTITNETSQNSTAALSLNPASKQNSVSEAKEIQEALKNAFFIKAQSMEKSGLKLWKRCQGFWLLLP